MFTLNCIYVTYEMRSIVLGFSMYPWIAMAMAVFSLNLANWKKKLFDLVLIRKPLKTRWAMFNFELLNYQRVNCTKEMIKLRMN